MGVVGFPEVSSDRLLARRLWQEQRDRVKEDSIGTYRSEVCCMSFQECLTRIVLLCSPLPCSPVSARLWQRAEVSGSSSCLSCGC